MNEDNEAIMAVGVVLVCLSLLFGVNYYQAGLQVEAYHRQGIEISRWEVMNGVNPAEQVVKIKSEK